MKVTLTVTAGPHQGRTVEFTRHDTFIVGRAAYAHFRLPRKDRHFSRAHFMIEVNAPLCRLVDMGSTNGTLVNDEKIAEIDLHDGDQIRGGNTVFEVGISADPQVTNSLTRTREQAPPALLDETNRHFGHFIIHRPLGQGGMGVVHLATDTRTGKNVALKMLRAQGAAHKRDRELFVREASILSQLRHPNIVRFMETGQVQDNVYYAMEYVRSMDCQNYLAKYETMPLWYAISITCQLLSALDYAHTKEFVHRDIKPANLLLYRRRRRLRLKLADFGLGRMYQQSRLSGLTATGDWGGSLPFMPPEQITNYSGAKPTVDIFAVAATLYNLLTNQFIHDFPPQTGKKLAVILDKDPVPINQRRGDLPPGLVDTIMRALAREPSDRFSNANAFRCALVPFLAESSGRD